jgi:hypothetical protein
MQTLLTLVVAVTTEKVTNFGESEGELRSISDPISKPGPRGHRLKPNREAQATAAATVAAVVAAASTATAPPTTKSPTHNSLRGAFAHRFPTDTPTDAPAKDMNLYHISACDQCSKESGGVNWCAKTPGRYQEWGESKWTMPKLKLQELPNACSRIDQTTQYTHQPREEGGKVMAILPKQAKGMNLYHISACDQCSKESGGVNWCVKTPGRFQEWGDSKWTMQKLKLQDLPNACSRIDKTTQYTHQPRQGG